MPEKSKSKSGLFEILSVKGGKSKFDTTEVEIRIPKFRNFGLGLAELESQATNYEKKLEAETTPAERAKKEAEWAKEEAEGDAFLKDLAESMRSAAAESKKEISKASPKDKDVGAASFLADAMEQLAKSLEVGPDDPDPDEETVTKKESRPEDFELFTAMPGDGIKWDVNAEARVDEFIRNWPDVRPQVLKQAHAYYKKLYPELKDTFGDMSTFNFTMPKPTKPEVVEDIFSISTIYLRGDGAIGISGSCTWDEEHGFGAVIKDGKIVTFGHADEGFC
ncbi:MAG: hypothetical protein HOP33_05925 [Verrucomicrobia bacterium]|nr:hypothetical protein [Verrucomicrobiota bacterium]